MVTAALVAGCRENKGPATEAPKGVFLIFTIWDHPELRDENHEWDTGGQMEPFCPADQQQRPASSWLGSSGKRGGLFWVQDFSLEGKSIQEVRQEQPLREGVQIEIQGMAGGSYTITPYDTWQGTYLETFEVTCIEGRTCAITLPDFVADMAFKVERN
ncbi:MAG: hypothetical protein L0332_24995 [Chloroflexi bacterium]|nr:hypothetical protein [Chloroflexota bacterium]MCI0575147.1 hypothetical protein [Chloroflexota bacterium]MCI0647171.1 hypothetical protein [Chloroflexota bacterium]MCI0729953.1 hypothetical protein [Chloroflexota bacterium]